MIGRVSLCFLLLSFKWSHQELFLIKTKSGGNAAEVTGEDYQHNTVQYVGDCDIDDYVSLPSYYLSYTLECDTSEYVSKEKITTTTRKPATTTTTKSTGVPLLQNLWTYLLLEEGGLKYYKIPVAPETRMNIGVVTATCQAQGMKSLCLKDGCIYNTPHCRDTPLSDNCNIPMRGLSRKICNTNDPRYCSSMDGLFTDHLSTLHAGTKGQGACGYVSTDPARWKNQCVSGDGYVSSKTKPLYAYCVSDTTTTSPPTKTTKIKGVQLQNLWTYLLVNEGGLEYYKIPVAPGKRMNIGVVTATCQAQGMSSVCMMSGCKYNSPGCRTTPLSENCYVPMRGLSRKICNNNDPRYCSSMDGMFADHLTSLPYGTKGQGACGYVSTDPARWKNQCVSGDGYVSSKTKPLYAYCVSDTNRATTPPNTSTKTKGSADNCIVSNIDYYGNDIKKIKDIRSAEDCSCECKKHVRCKFFTWIEKKKFCWLKTRVGKIKIKNGVQSGSKNCCGYSFGSNI